MDHHPYPPHDRFREASVVLREELRLEGRDHHHAGSAIRNADGHPDLRLDLQDCLHTSELFGVIVEVAGQEGLTFVEYPDYPSPIRSRQDVEAAALLQRGKRLG